MSAPRNNPQDSPQDSIDDWADQLLTGGQGPGGHLEDQNPAGGSLDIPGLDPSGDSTDHPTDRVERFGDRDMEVLDQFDKSQHHAPDNPAGDLPPIGIIGTEPADPSPAGGGEANDFAYPDPSPEAFQPIE